MAPFSRTMLYVSCQLLTVTTDGELFFLGPRYVSCNPLPGRYRMKATCDNGEY